jgi:hypothetical protein
LAKPFDHYFKEERMTEETIYATPTAIFRVGRGTLEAATVDGGEKGRALFLFRDEADAEEYRLATGIYPAEEGFKPVSLEVGALRDVLAAFECTHVVSPTPLTADSEGPDFFAAEAFVGILQEFPPVEVA